MSFTETYRLDESILKIYNRFVSFLIHVDMKKLTENDKIKFTNFKRDQALKIIKEFENTFIDSLSKVYIDYKNIELNKLNDKDFLIFLDEFIDLTYRALRMKILDLQVIRHRYQLVKFEKDINLEILKKMSVDIITFINSVQSILNEETVKDEVSKTIRGIAIKNILTKRPPLPEIPKEIFNLRNVKECYIEVGE